jgi:hypothetical protein
VNHLEAEVI